MAEIEEVAVAPRASMIRSALTASSARVPSSLARIVRTSVGRMERKLCRKMFVSIDPGVARQVIFLNMAVVFRSPKLVMAISSELMESRAPIAPIQSCPRKRGWKRRLKQH